MSANEDITGFRAQVQLLKEQRNPLVQPGDEKKSALPNFLPPFGN